MLYFRITFHYGGAINRHLNEDSRYSQVLEPKLQLANRCVDAPILAVSLSGEGGNPFQAEFILRYGARPQGTLPITRRLCRNIKKLTFAQGGGGRVEKLWSGNLSHVRFTRSISWR